MITKDSIETAYSFLHQKRNVYIHSSLDWQRDDIEYAIASFVDGMSQELLESISDGRKDFLRDHRRFQEDITLAVEKLEDMLNLSCTTKRYSADIDAKAYIKGFRRTDYFIKLCQQCRNYNHRYGCPPFDDATLAIIDGYEKVRIIGVKIIPNNKRLPLKMANDLMKPVITKLNEELLELEQSLGGYAFGFVGTCLYCGGAPCARIKGKPCRHPEKVRPSLEAFGFDMSKTAKDLLGLEIKWSKGELIPEYLTLVCGVFYQNDEKIRMI